MYFQNEMRTKPKQSEVELCRENESPTDLLPRPPPMLCCCRCYRSGIQIINRVNKVPRHLCATEPCVMWNCPCSCIKSTHCIYRTSWMWSVWQRPVPPAHGGSYFTPLLQQNRFYSRTRFSSSTKGLLQWRVGSGCVAAYTGKDERRVRGVLQLKVCHCLMPTCPEKQDIKSHLLTPSMYYLLLGLSDWLSSLSTHTLPAAHLFSLLSELLKREQAHTISVTLLSGGLGLFTNTCQPSFPKQT